MTIRITGAIAFKNYLKRNWNAHEDSDGPDRINESDRIAIKSLLVTLMLKSLAALQKQLGDAVSIIGKYDFPKKWPQLIDEIVEAFSTGDFNVINAVLQTAHSLFKRYRFEIKSQPLWEEIKLVLDRMAQPLTDLLLAAMNLTKVHEGNQPALKVIYKSLVLVCKVFYSLNSQDLAEFFKYNMGTWMNAFHELLIKDVPCLRTEDEEEGGVIEHLRSQVCENLNLYAQKYDEIVTDTSQQSHCCGKTFLSRSGFLKHKQAHCKEKQYVCNVCEKAFGRSDSLTRHKKIHNKRRRNFVCLICKTEYKYKRTLKENTSWVHKNVITTENVI